MRDTDILILGGGLAGLAAASVLGERATVLEREAAPGGLVRAVNYNGYWFDRVLHILYFSDTRTEERVRRMLGPALVSNPPVAWVECAAGATRYPFQVHLGGLTDRDAVIRCVHDMAREHFAGGFQSEPGHFEEALLRAFGRGICELFMFPYNEKVWKRPLAELAPSGFQWNIARPDFNEVLKGAISSYDEFAAYNAKGWYPSVPCDQPVRGMEYLSSTLAATVPDLQLNTTVTAIDLEARQVTAQCRQETVTYRYNRLCSTIPLPVMLRLCRQTPDPLRAQAADLTWNRVTSVAFSVEGPRPRGCGHWRYYADPRLIFNRLIFMHEFDPEHAPPQGWGLMAEITEPSVEPMQTIAEIIRRTQADVLSTGVLPKDCRIVDAHVIVADPAYVVFTKSNRRIVDESRVFFERHDVELLGRYGRWEYSSMAQVMRDGFEWAEEQSALRGAA